MTFAAPYFFALLAVIPLLLFVRSRRRPREVPAGFSDLGLLAGYRPTWRIRYRWLPTAVRAAALALLVVALARPQAGQAESVLPGEGIDIALVMDTSSSMQSFLDEETRLAAAQQVIKDFIAGRDQDRLGLVIFREQSLVLSPLTLDYDALTKIVDSVDQVNLSDGTAIGVGLADALNLLRESKARSRVAILLTDGENNAGNVEPLAAARIAETLGIRVYTIGVVDAASRRAGNSNVDERALLKMAQLTGGRYFAADSETALSDVYQSIDSLEKSRVGRTQYAAYDELAVYPLFAALLLLALELFLKATIWKRSA